MDLASKVETGHPSLYSYRPLQSGHIRLANVYPGKPTDPIECDIIHAPIEGIGSKYYEAVSYAWGDATLHPDISCGVEGVVRVTNNCVSAIKRLRYRDRERLLWIDGLCIDQSNEPEKSIQVRQMGKIFGTAGRVLIYLGEPDEHSDRALKRIANDGASPTPRDVQDMQKFLERPWFERVWVLQEVAFSRSAYAICGDMCVPWGLFTAHHMWKAHAIKFMRATHFRSPAVLSYASESSFPRTPLLQQLNYSRLCKASDPRDKVIALLGMTNPSDGWNRLIDYSMTTEQIYTSLARRLVEQDRSLRVLSGAHGSSPEHASLPTWVPDWSVCPVMHTFGLGHHRKGLYNAGGHPAVVEWSTPSAELGGECSVLIAQGVKVGSVHMVDKPMDDIQNGLEFREGLIQWRTGHISPSNHDSTTTYQDHQFFRVIGGNFPGLLSPSSDTPLLGSKSEDSVDPDPLYRDCHRWYLYITSVEHFRMQGFQLEWLKEFSDSSDETLHLHDSYAYSFHHSVETAVHRRRLFRTDRGMLGMGLRGLEVGDVVVVLLGGSVPHILRPQPEKPGFYSVIGECYVDGIMDGEALYGIEEELAALGHVSQPGERKGLNSPKPVLETFNII